MSYPNIRCRNFDDDGKAVGHCYKGKDCTFTHPDDPRWAHARRRMASGGGGISSGNFSSMPPRRSDNGWSRDSSFSNSRANRGIEKDSYTNSGWAKQPELGEPSSGSTLAPAWEAIVSKESSKDNNSTSGWDNKSGWGSSAGESAWKSDGANAWNTSPDKDPSNTTPASATASVWESGRGWGESGSADAWDKANGKGKEKAQDVIMTDSTPAQSGWGAPPPPPVSRADSVISNHTRRKELPQLQTDSESPHPSHPSPMPTATPSSKLPLAASALPPRRVSSALLSTGNLQKAAKIYTKVSQDDASRASGGDSPATPVTKQYLGRKGRVDLFRDTLSEIFDLAISEIIYRHALDDDERWKQTRASQAYERATPMARQKLGDIMTRQRKKLFEAERIRGANMKALLRLPAVATEFKALHPEVTKAKVKSYVDEVRIWVRDLHSLLSAETERKANTENHEASKTRSSFQGLINEINKLEEKLGQLNAFFDEIRATGKDYQSSVSVPPLLPLPNEEDEEDDSSRAMLDKIALLRSDVSEVGEILKNEADQVTALMLEFSRIHEQLGFVAKENERMVAVCEWAEQQLDRLSAEQKADESHMNEVTESLKKLQMEDGQIPEDASISSSYTQPFTSMNVEELYEHIRPIVVKQITDEALPILDAIRKRSKEYQDKVEEDVIKLVKEINSDTETILKGVTPLNSRPPPPQSQ